MMRVSRYHRQLFARGRDSDYAICPTCQGMKYLSKPCRHCGGNGKVGGSICRACGGTGEVREPCRNCQASGFVRRW